MSIGTVRDTLLFAVKRNTLRHKFEFKRMVTRCIRGGGRMHGFSLEEVRYCVRTNYGPLIRKRGNYKVRIGGLDYTNID